jgi:hypothetical protein
MIYAGKLWKDDIKANLRSRVIYWILLLETIAHSPDPCCTRSRHHISGNPNDRRTARAFHLPGLLNGI